MNKRLTSLIVLACVSAATAAYAQRGDDNSLPSGSSNGIRGSANPANNQISGSMAVYPPPDVIKPQHKGIITPEPNTTVKPVVKQKAAPTQKNSSDESDGND